MSFDYSQLSKPPKPKELEPVVDHSTTEHPSEPAIEPPNQPTGHLVSKYGSPPVSQSVDSRSTTDTEQPNQADGAVVDHSAIQPQSEPAPEPLNQFSPATLRDRSFRSRQNVKHIGVRMPEDRKLILKTWCVAKGIDLQEFILEAIYEKASGLVVDLLSGEPVQWVSGGRNDSDDLDQIDNEVLSIYRRETGNRIRAGDREVALELAALNPRHVECGILVSIWRAAVKSPPSRVNSLRYCLGAIEEMVATHRDDVGTYLEYVRGKVRDLGLR